MEIGMMSQNTPPRLVGGESAHLIITADTDGTTRIGIYTDQRLPTIDGRNIWQRLLLAGRGTSYASARRAVLAALDEGPVVLERCELCQGSGWFIHAAHRTVQRCERGCPSVRVR